MQLLDDLEASGRVTRRSDPDDGADQLLDFLPRVKPLFPDRQSTSVATGR